MDDTARSFAIARVNKWILWSGLIRQANLTTSFKLFLEVENVLSGPINLRKVERLSLFSIVDLENNQLNPSKLNEIADS